MELNRNFESAQKAISAALIATTRSASRISAEDANFHRSSDSAVARSIEEEGNRLLSLADKLLHQSSRSEGRVRVRLRNLETTDTDWKTVVDELDLLLERTDIALDEYAGYFRKRRDDSRDSSPIPKQTRTLPREFRSHFMTTKPQLSFIHKPSNHETGPFKPILHSKPHARIELPNSIKIASDGGYTHPYQYEISNYELPPFVYETAAPIDPQPFNSTHAIFVDSIEALHTMLAELRTAKEIAVDLEHHDTHSYIGIVSLMQISTREQDWIIDTLKPWRRELEILNEVFADPLILKVLHGAQMDVIWLQRDFGLYLVGLFDTYHASRILGYTRHSLAYLLKKFIGFEAQKQYQTADWRIRPLPSELFDYARSDTHFLLFIYDNMRNELIQNSTNQQGDKIHNVLQASQKYALQRYEHPISFPWSSRSHNGWFSQLLKVPANLTNAQLGAFRRLHEWRDKVGRDEDESTNYVMPNFALHNVAISLPTNTVELFTAMGTPSHIARARANELVAIILDSQHNSCLGADIRRDLNAFHASQDTTQKKHLEPVPEMPSGDNGVVTIFPDKLRAETSHFWGSAASTGNLSALLSLPSSFNLTLGLHTSDSQLLTRADENAIDRPGKRKTIDVEKNLTKADTEAQEQVVGQTHSVSLPRVKARVKAQAKKPQEINMRTKELLKEPGDTKVQNIPFDYDNEPSIMRHEDKQNFHQRKKAVRESFDPFAKAADVQGGLGRVQSSKSGRTATFRSEPLQ